VLALLVAIPLIPWRVARIKLCNFYGHTVGRAVVACAGAQPHVTHRERLDGKRPAIYVNNHTSTLDAFLAIWLCPYGGCGVFKKEIANIPFFGQLLRLSGHLMLDRANSAGAVQALKDIAQLVNRKGLSIWIMPEGTRSKDGRLLPLKKGFVHLAIATGLPIVPVVFHSAHRIWPLGAPLFKAGKMDIEVLEPIETKGWVEERSAEHAQLVHDALARALRAEQRAA
jgi:1-acyl-sn-glycerol-3-phosphate acyltransferase